MCRNSWSRLKHVNNASNALVVCGHNDLIERTLRVCHPDRSRTSLRAIDRPDQRSRTCYLKMRRSQILCGLPERPSLFVSLILIFSTAYLAHLLPRYREAKQTDPLDERLGGKWDVVEFRLEVASNVQVRFRLHASSPKCCDFPLGLPRTERLQSGLRSRSLTKV